VILRQGQDRPLVVGHRGAAALAPENTLEALETAVEVGADMVEFDVDEGLVVGHPGGPASNHELHLDDALRYLATKQIGIHLDLKLVGAEAEIGRAVETHGLSERVVVSSTCVSSVRALATDAPALARAISYPQDRYGISKVAWPTPMIRASSVAVRPYVRARVARLLGATNADALSLHHSLVNPWVVGHARARGAAVIAWTVNDPSRVAHLAGLGVDAIVSDDPRMALDVLATLEMQ
jgi:glycerophosphoryl diester phosphodiesterase